MSNVVALDNPETPITTNNRAIEENLVLTIDLIFLDIFLYTYLFNSFIAHSAARLSTFLGDFILDASLRKEICDLSLALPIDRKDSACAR